MVPYSTDGPTYQMWVLALLDRARVSWKTLKLPSQILYNFFLILQGKINRGVSFNSVLVVSLFEHSYP